MEKRRPSFERKLGTVRITVWRNVSKEKGREWFSATIVRRYKAGDEWKEVNTFNGIAELSLVRQGIDLALDWINQQSEPVEVQNSTVETE